MQKMSLSLLASLSVFFTSAFFHSAYAEFSPMIKSEKIFTKQKKLIQDSKFDLFPPTIAEVRMSEYGIFDDIYDQLVPEDGQNPDTSANHEAPKVRLAAPENSTLGIDKIIMEIDKMLAIGDKVMSFIEKSKPIFNNTQTAAVSVIPKLPTPQDGTLLEMANWSVPEARKFKVTYKNSLGLQVVSFIFVVTYQYNGTYQGKGHYLTGVKVSAKDVQVNWGYQVDSSSQLIQISNVGTEDNIIAGATMEITYTIKNRVRSQTTSQLFHITGDGRLYSLD